ncbi:MAG: hypothetical protein KAS46_07110 [Candidatus Aureabacteria bacterium]|nr:hypothetical protein [Candidatus Auribacterota bacterium]
MKIVWIRHGPVDYNSQVADVLIGDAQKFARNLPNILCEHELNPQIAYFDNSLKFKKNIERCYKTIVNLDCEKKTYNSNDTNFIKHLSHELVAKKGTVLFKF